jgi:hypothetical protein
MNMESVSTQALQKKWTHEWAASLVTKSTH